MTAILLALTSAFIYGVSDFLGGLASRKISATAVVAITQPIGLLGLLAVFPLLPGRPHLTDLLWNAASGIGFVIGTVLFYIALARSRMALISPIAAVVGAIMPVLFGYILGEHTSFSASIGVVLGCIAVGFASTTPGKDRITTRDPGIIPALWSGVGFGISLSFLSRSGHDAGLWPLLTAQITSTIGIWVWIALHPVSFHLDRRMLLLIPFVGILNTTAGACYVLATHVGLLPIVAVLASLYPVSTVLLACTVLREPLSSTQWMGIACAICGVAFIAWGS
jgi:drug/metabolite transporter (DMT)-like permease